VGAILHGKVLDCGALPMCAMWVGVSFIFERGVEKKQNLSSVYYSIAYLFEPICENNRL
jgi:hypothetical protein